MVTISFDWSNVHTEDDYLVTGQQRKRMSGFTKLKQIPVTIYLFRSEDKKMDLISDAVNLYIGLLRIFFKPIFLLTSCTEQWDHDFIVASPFS